jgi:ATP-dependent DNA helicase RecQ
VPKAVADSADRLRQELHPERGEVDWRPVDRRREAAQARIDAVERYARARGCRRAAVLDYFGERARGCSGCDRCGDREVPVGTDRDARRRLASLRRAVASVAAPWPGGLLDGETLARLAARPPGTVEELAAVPGIGAPLAARFGRLLVDGLRDEPPPPEKAPVIRALLQWREETARALGIASIELMTERSIRAIAAAAPADASRLASVGGLGPRFKAKFAAELVELIGRAATLENSEPPSAAAVP